MWLSPVGPDHAGLSTAATKPDPTDADIDLAMNGNLCRRGTYDRIRKAIKNAALTMQEVSQWPC